MKDSCLSRAAVSVAIGVLTKYVLSRNRDKGTICFFEQPLPEFITPYTPEKNGIIYCRTSRRSAVAASFRRYAGRARTRRCAVAEHANTGCNIVRDTGA
jgi:rhodanese-related sulfurtransferase